VFLAVWNNDDLARRDGQIWLAGHLHPRHAFSDEMIDDELLGARGHHGSGLLRQRGPKTPRRRELGIEKDRAGHSH
jgi:hypothetical protein